MSTRSIVMLIIWFVVVIVALLGLFYLTFFTETVYYTQVDNACLVEITPRGSMYYRYELPGVDERGKERLLSFDTTRILRDDALLRVTVAPLRGVTAWEEVQPGDIPNGAGAVLDAAGE